MWPGDKKGFSEKSSLEKTLIAEIYGPPELRRREKQVLLGQFRERVIKALTFEQIVEPGTYPEIQQAMNHPQAKKLIISRKADLAAAADYIKLARQRSLSFSTIDQPDFHGNVGLIVAAQDAVDVADIFVQTRAEKLLMLGIPEEVINSPGQHLCEKCRSLLEQRAPEELVNYPARKWYCVLAGKCPCQRH
jgi:uncharacterized protein YueI